MNRWGNIIWEAGDELYRFPFLNTALWNKIILRETALKHVKFENPPRIAEDALFLMSIYPHIQRISFVEEPLYSYFVRGDTAMSYMAFNETDNILKCFDETRKYLNGVTDDKRWDSVMEIAAYIHLGVSLLLRCRRTESREYIKKARSFLKRGFPRQNLYMKCFWEKGFLKIQLVRIMYLTGLIYLVPYLKKYVNKIIKW